MTEASARSALLYDTAASLRLLDTELRALGAPPDELPDDAQPAGLAASPSVPSVPSVLECAHAEVQAVLATLREGRLALETSAAQRLQHTGAKLQEVTSATDVPATDILDALDRTQGQDTTTQQLAHASHVLGDMERRLLQVARLVDPAAVAARAVGGMPAPDPRTFDPSAAARDAGTRQAGADALFVGR